MSIKPQESRATWKTFRRCGSGQSAESSLDVWSGRHCCHARFYIESREFHHDWISRTRCRIDRDDSPGGLTLSKPTLQQQIATMIYISYRKMNRERLAAKLENWAESLGKMVDALCGKLNDYYLLLNGESEFSNDQNVNDLSMINTFLVCGPGVSQWSFCPLSGQPMLCHFLSEARRCRKLQPTPNQWTGFWSSVFWICLPAAL